MKLFKLLPATMVSSHQIVMAGAAPSNTPQPFTSDFHQPPPPLVKPAFQAHWNQHKYNENVSHIASGYMYSSPTSKKIRADETYDGALGSSLFDYNNVTAEGVSNVVWLLTPTLTSTPQFYTGYVQPGFPLVEADLLVKARAVYAGTTIEPYVGEVTKVTYTPLPSPNNSFSPRKAMLTVRKWNFLFGNSLPTTLLVDSHGIIHGWDAWATNERTFIITRLFNIVVGEVSKDVFDFPQASG